MFTLGFVIGLLWCGFGLYLANGLYGEGDRKLVFEEPPRTQIAAVLAWPIIAWGLSKAFYQREGSKLTVNNRIIWERKERP